MDSVYKIRITLEEKAILCGDEIKEMKPQMSHFSVFTLELDKEYTPSLRSSCF